MLFTSAHMTQIHVNTLSQIRTKSIRSYPALAQKANKLQRAVLRKKGEAFSLYSQIFLQSQPSSTTPQQFLFAYSTHLTKFRERQ